MQGDNYSDLTHIAGDSYFPPAIHSRAQRQTCVIACLSVYVHVYVFLYLNSPPPWGHFYQLVTESSDL